MRVLHLFLRLDHGGAEIRTLDRLRAASDSDFEHHLCMLDDAPGVFDDAFREAGAILHTCPFDRGFPPRFVKLLRRVRPDVVHANQQWASAGFLSLARVAGVRGRVCQFHASQGGGSATVARRVRDRVFRRVLRHNATAITGVSEGVLDALWYPGWRSDPLCSVEYLGVDLAPYDRDRDREGVRAELGIPADARIAIHVGNMRAAKNHPGLGALFAELAPRVPDLHLLAVGRRYPEFEVPFRAAAGNPDRVHLVGARDDIPRLLLASDVLLLPSVTEGLPTVVLEARAAGIPVVASDLAGTLESARFLSRIHCASLDQPWAHWADLVEAALDQGLDPTDREHNALAGTPFDAVVSAHAHEALWRRSVR